MRPRRQHADAWAHVNIHGDLGPDGHIDWPDYEDDAFWPILEESVTCKVHGEDFIAWHVQRVSQERPQVPGCHQLLGEPQAHVLASPSAEGRRRQGRTSGPARPASAARHTGRTRPTARSALGGIANGADRSVATSAPIHGVSPFKGYRITCFTNVEEEGVGLASRAQWLLETEVQDKVGVQFSRGPIWEPYMVEDRNLITGQNPNSAMVLAERLLKGFA
jgi:hypothetical protein